jgi:hypothetical protein
MEEIYENRIADKLRQSDHETHEIQLILKKLEAMEQMEDSEELENEIMSTVQQYPELMSAMKSYEENHDFEKEKVEYERLKLEEQISMLEKVNEEGIKQTTELQEIHHSEVEDLHKQIINLQKQVANHVRFIDDHCVDSEEIRTEMQKDIDRLVSKLEDQEKQNRTSTSLQTQVQRLEGEMAELTTKLACAAEGERRAKEQLEIRKDERITEVTDLQNEVTWFRGEYDQLLLKLNKCEEELSNIKFQLTENQSQLSTVEAKMNLEQTKNSELKNQIDENKKSENEKIEILKNELAEVKNVAETQKNELQYLKSELEKSKEIISKLSLRRESISEGENEDFFAGMKKRKSSSDSLEDEINEAEEFELSMTHNNDSLKIKMKKKLEYLEQKLEKKSNAFNELKRENLRLKDSVDRKKRTLKKGDKLAQSMQDLSKDSTSDQNKTRNYESRHSHEEYDSEESGYVASHLGGSYQHIESASSLLSLDQQSDMTPTRRRLSRRFGSAQILNGDDSSVNYDSSSPVTSRKPMTSTPKVRYVKECEGCRDIKGRSRLSSSVEFKRPSANQKAQIILTNEKPETPVHTREFNTQTFQPLTHSAKVQASPRMVTCSVQTYEPYVDQSPAQKTSSRFTPTHTYESFETDKYLTGRNSRPEPTVRPIKSRPEHDFSRLEACLSDKRDEVKDLRHQLREREEAFARQNAEIQILKRQLRDQERDFNRARRQSSNPAIQIPSNDKHDIKINLSEGNQDDYGKIEQIQPGQIQELKTVRKTVKNVNGIPISYSTKVSVKCQKVAVFF